MRNVFALLLLASCAAGIGAAQVTFSSTRYGFSTTPVTSVSGDFNRDGRPDIAVANQDPDQGRVTVFLGTGGGKFGAPADYPTTTVRPRKVLTADINNDGALDLLVDEGDTNDVSVLLGNGDGTFRSGPNLFAAFSVRDFDFGDFNHDGAIDVALVECNDVSGSCDMQAEIGHNDGTFTPGYKIQMTGDAGGLSVRDMNGDGNLDLLLIRTNNILIFGGDGTGRFPVFTKFTPPAHCTDPNVCTDALESVVAADFNNDTRLDFAVLQAHACGSACGDNTVYLYKNSGGWSFARVSQFNVGTSADGWLLAADLNGDQNIDLLGWDQDFRAGWTTFEQGAGNFTFTQRSINVGGANPAQMIARDLNLDSRHDVIDTEAGPADNSMIVALNTSAFTNCAPPNSANLAAKICGLANNASVASPVLVKGSGNSPAGVARLEIWIDGHKQYQKWNDQVAKKFTLAAGSHRITVVAVDMYKGTAKTSATVNVQ